MIEGGEDPVHCPAARHKCCRGHRPCKSQRPAACQCRFRRRDEDRMARRAHPALPRLRCISQRVRRAIRLIWALMRLWGLCGRRATSPYPHLRNAPTALMAQLGYHDGYKVLPRLSRAFHGTAVYARRNGGQRIWHAQHSPMEEKQYQQMLRCWGRQVQGLKRNHQHRFRISLRSLSVCQVKTFREMRNLDKTILKE